MPYWFESVSLNLDHLPWEVEKGEGGIPSYIQEIYSVLYDCRPENNLSPQKSLQVRRSQVI